MSSSGFLLDVGERVEAVLALLQSQAPEGWRPHRILFRNFWFFHAEEFIWHHGRLFLGGQNAAGKSTVLSMAVPLLLDGNKSEERLNTFGGHGRHMAYYVTGSPNPDDTSEAAYYHQARTSYMAIEFARRSQSGEERYLTFGQGLHHDRNAEDKSVKSWGFVIRDGRRLGRFHHGQAFDLLRESGTSLTKPELKRLLGAGGEVFDTNLEYKKEVNRLLFGFKDLRDFDSLIDLLLQIRRPKLTKEVRPRDVAEILTLSLPTLDAGVMQVTSAALDHIDQTTENLERIDRQIRAALEVEKATQVVFRRMAEAAAAQFEAAAATAGEAGAALAEHEAKLAQARTDLAESTMGLAEAKRRAGELSSERQTLQEQETFQAAERQAVLDQEIAARAEGLHELRRTLREQEAALKKLQAELYDKEGEWHREREAALDTISGAAPEAERARWEAARHWLTDLRDAWGHLVPRHARGRLTQSVPRAAAQADADARLRRIAALKELAARRDAAHAQWQRARESEDAAQQRFFGAEAAVTALANRSGDLRHEAAAAVQAWVQEYQAAGIPAEAAHEAAVALSHFIARMGERPGYLLEPLRAHLRQAAAENSAACVRANQHLSEMQSRVGELDEQRRLLDNAPPVPPLSRDRIAARAALADAGIVHAPFFETVDFTGAVLEEEAAAVEQALLDMGLLDALVVRPQDRDAAVATLRSQGLGEQFLAPVGEGSGGTGWLTTEASHPLASAAGKVLSHVGEGIARIELRGVWQHGLLEGVPAPAPASRYIGRTARERYRRAEILRLDSELRAAKENVRAATEALKSLEDQSALIEAARQHLEALPPVAALHDLCLQLELRQEDVERERQALNSTRKATAAARRVWDEAEAALLAACKEFPAAQGLGRQGLAELAEATRAISGAFDRIYQQARTLEGLLYALDRTAELISAREREIEDGLQKADDLAVELRRLEGDRAGLERLLARPDAQALFERLREINAELAELEARKDKLNRQEAVAMHQVDQLEKGLPALSARAQSASLEASGARLRLREAVAAYPTLQSYEASAASEEGARKVARTLLSRWVDRPTLVQDIREQEDKDRGFLTKVFYDQRDTLRNFYPDHLPGERTNRLLQFSLDGTPLTPHALVEYLQAQAETLRNVLHRHEAELFERHLLQDVGLEVRRCMLKAHDWRNEINSVLEDYPLRNEERVELVWEPKRTEHELGGTIARHAELLRIDESLLTPAQRDILRSAFQEEIRQIREQAKRGEWRADLFREKLAEMLDYRNWFRFRIFVRGGAAGRTEITDTVHNARSGSERALVLLLPLLAGLSVRYDNASPDAPRLFALDEGFAGIDGLNSRQLIRFLTRLRLTWVVTSEKPLALTEELTGASFYSLLREGTVVATRAFFWNGDRMIDAEAEFWEGTANHE